MQYIILAIFPYVIYSVSYYADKFLLTKSKVDGSVGNLMIGSSLISGGILFPVFFYLTKFKIISDLRMLGLVVLMVMIMMLSLYSYYKAMETLRSSVVAILFLLVPVFSFVWAHLLGESFSFSKILGAILIISSAIYISFEPKFELKPKATLLMVGSSFGWSIFYLLFSKISGEIGFLETVSFYQLFLVLFGLVLLINKNIRSNFLSLFKTEPRFLIVNIIVKVSDMAALLITNYSMVFIPIALASSLVGTGPVITIIIGLAGAKLLPKYFDDQFSRDELKKLIIATILSILGIVLMFAI